MPTYEASINQINSSPAEEVIKLQEKNNLHNELISAIDKKIVELKAEQLRNPESLAIIDEEINKLEELKAAKQAEIAKNNEQIKSINTGDVANKSVANTNADNFNSSEGKEIIASHEKDINEIKAIDQDIADLENQLDNADTQKDKDKIEKQIEKKKIVQAKIENEIIEDLADVNKNEYTTTKSAVVVNGDIASSKNPSDEDIKNANADLNRADILMQEAAILRDEASKEKNPVVANEKLELAFAKETEAKNLIENANNTYKSAIVIDQYSNNDNVVVTNVPENKDERQSTQFFDEAHDLESKANSLNERSAFLMDSSLTVKKKYREAIVIEAQRLDSLASVYRDEASNLKTKGNELQTQENEILAALPDKVEKNVDDETIKDVASTPEYKNYFTEKTTGDSNLFKAEEIGLEIEELQERKNKKIKQAVVTYGDGPELNTALSNDPEFLQIQKSIDSLADLQAQYKEKALNNYKNADVILAQTDDQTRENILAISNNDVTPLEKVAVVTINVQDADFKAPSELSSSIFRTTNGAPVYSNDKPIPVDQQTSGLVYKVQVGAFRKPLPQEYFNQFAPISGQKIADGITRYMAGYFTNFTLADNAKSQIRGEGYTDAFVVAYCNGERISVGEAREIEAGRKQCPGTNMEAVNNMTINQTTGTVVQNNTGTGNNTTANNQNQNTTTVVTPTSNEEKQLTSYYTNTDGAAPANQVEIMKGLFFTVQIGVYSKPVKASLLYNIQPLNSQLTENNKIRYTTGIYTSVEAATIRKNEIVQIGIEDAFVTAYYNGQRISLTEANDLLAKNGPSILFNAPANATNQNTNNQNTNNQNTNNQNTNNQNTNNQNTNNQNTNNQNTNNQNTNNQNTNNQNTNNQNTNNQNTNNQNTNNQNTTNQNSNNQNTNNQNTNNTGTDTAGLFRVRVGYFQEEVPQPFIELLLNNQDEGIVSESDFDENITFYTIPFTSKEEAELRRTDLINKGFTQADLEKMPPNVDEYGNKIEVVEPKEVFHREGIYYRVLIGKYQNEIPGQYATIILQTENLLDTEVDADGNTYIISTKIGDFETMKERLIEFSELGFEDMQIVTYYKYDPIPFEEGEKILNYQAITKINPYPTPQGISADPYLYRKEAVYFRVDLGKFYEDVPSDFANLLFEHSEENILREETLDGEIIFYTENMKSYEEGVKAQQRLMDKGFKLAKLVAFHKYDEISVEKARQILEN